MANRYSDVHITPSLLKQQFIECQQNVTELSRRLGITRAVTATLLNKHQLSVGTLENQHSVQQVLSLYLEVGSLAHVARKTQLTPHAVKVILQKHHEQWRETNVRPQSNASPFNKADLIRQMQECAFRPHMMSQQIGKSYRRWAHQLQIDVPHEHSVYQAMMQSIDPVDLVGTHQEYLLNGLEGKQEFISQNILRKNISLFDKNSLMEISNILKIPLIHIKNFRIKNNLPICVKICGTSVAELEILEFVKSMAPSASKQIFTNNGKRFELDIYIPEFNLGVEYNGSYWHSDEVRNKDYHRTKRNYFSDLGIQVMNIFDHQWSGNCQIVKSKILHAMGMSQQRFDARKCKIMAVSNSQYRQFCIDNHIQGFAPAAIRWGLWSDHQLIALVALGKPRFDKSFKYELIRSCTKLNTVVRGGVSRLFQHAVSHMIAGDTLVSYNNDMIGNGNIYTKLGFHKVGTTDPSYFYSNGREVRTRYQSQKHLLVEMPHYSKDLSENEIMRKNGFFRIYDCGTTKYIFNIRK